MNSPATPQQFEDLPPGWARAALPELVDVLDSRRIPVNASERQARSGPVPYYGAAGQVGTIDSALFDEPLVLLGEDGVQFFDQSRPKAYLIVGPAWVNNHAHVLRAAHIHRVYLKHFLDQVDYHGLATGTTRLKLTQAGMRRITVAVPPASEQQRIVIELERRFSHVDAAAKYLTEVDVKIRAARAAIESELLWDPRFPQRKLRELLSDEGMANGHSVKDRLGGFPVLRLTCLREDRIDLGQFKEGDWEREDALRFLVRRGDFFVARGNGTLSLVGRGALVRDDPQDVAYPDTLIRVRTDASEITPEFLAAVWNTQGVRRQLEAVARTTAGIYKVNQRDLQSVTLPLPAIRQQEELTKELERRLSLVDAARRAAKESLRKAEQLKRSLLAAAFSGRLVPQDPNDEPAAVLLERIRAERAELAPVRAAKKAPRKRTAKRRQEAPT